MGNSSSEEEDSDEEEVEVDEWKYYQEAHSLVEQNNYEAFKRFAEHPTRRLTWLTSYSIALLPDAVQKGNKRIVELLWERIDATKVQHVNHSFRPFSHRRNPVQIAIDEGHHDILRWLCDKKFTCVDEFSNNHARPVNLTRSLIESGDVRDVRYCFSKEKPRKLQVVFKSKDECGFTPFLYAVQSGHVDIVKDFAKWLKPSFIDIKTTTHDQWTALGLAVSNRNEEMVRLLLGSHFKLGVNGNAWCGDTALQVAIAEDLDDMVPILCEFGAQNHKGWDSQGYSLKDWARLKPKYAPYLEKNYKRRREEI